MFRDRASAESYIAIASSQSSNNIITTFVIDLNPGTPIEFTKDVFENLIRQGKITSLQSTDTDGFSDKAREL